MVTALAHVCFTVRDLDASFDFYANKLGFTHAFDFINGQGGRHGCYLQIGGRSFIELCQGNYEEPKGGSYRHFCLEVGDIKQAGLRLAKNGYAATRKTLGADRSWQMWTTDPSGVRIELHQYTKASSQVTHKDCVLK